MRRLSPGRPNSGRYVSVSDSHLREPEGASLGVLADRPPLARMDDAPAERPDSFQRLADVADGEVRQRERVAGAAAARMDAHRRRASHRRRARARLPTLPLRVIADIELDAEQLTPEATGAIW